MNDADIEGRLDAVYAERIDCIDKITLHGKRPRDIGYNARIPTHGPRVSDPVVRLRTTGGGEGIGWSQLSQEQAGSLIGRSVGELFRLPDGSTAAAGRIDLPLWDLVARLLDLPLYRLLGARGCRRVPLYDASIYIDDLELDDDAARRLFADEVASGWEHGYRHFKVKVGRGARWMDTEPGLQRDALVVRAVRDAAGDEARIMIDANMGNTFNTATRLLELCDGCNLYWFEEPFAEDRVLNEALKMFIEENNWDILVADGEFAPPPNFFEMVRDGWIDIAQQDFHHRGLTWWRETAAHIEGWGGRCAPHTWGSYIERFAHAHFAASVANYEMLEASPARMPGIIDEDWIMEDGCLLVPDTPGAGFDVEPRIFAEGLEVGGFRVTT